MDRRQSYGDTSPTDELLQTYEKTLTTDTTLMLRPDSELLRYLQSPTGK
jgi:hypothetical protein